MGRGIHPALLATTRGLRKLDYFLLTHFHADHMGDSPGPDAPWSSGGDYQLLGVTEVAQHVPVATIVDRGYPHYDFPIPIQWPNVNNYRKFLKVDHNGTVEQFQVGSSTQFRMKRKSPFRDDFRIVNLKSNLDVISPDDDSTIQRISGQIFSNPAKQKWDENELSTAIRIEYGAFRYYEGGDQEAHRNDKGSLDVITPTATAAGKVDVATARTLCRPP